MVVSMCSIEKDPVYHLKPLHYSIKLFNICLLKKKETFYHVMLILYQIVNNGLGRLPSGE